MANIHGKNAFFAIEDSTSASRNLTADGNNVTLTESVNNPEGTHYGDNNVRRTASGQSDCKITYEAWANDTATTQNMAVLYALKGLSTTISYAPAGSNTGAGAASPDKYTACMLVDDVELRSPVTGLVVCRASFSLRSGSVTKVNGSGAWSLTF